MSYTPKHRRHMGEPVPATIAGRGSKTCDHPTCRGRHCAGGEHRLEPHRRLLESYRYPMRNTAARQETR